MSSLFGSPQSKPIFDDLETAGSDSNANSLFADDSGSKAPWELPTPKKPGQGELVKSILPESAVPESYIDAYDTLLDLGQRSGSGISAREVKKLLESTRLSSEEQVRLLKLVGARDAGDVGLGRSEFNVLLALIGLSLEGEEATLDGVDERRKKLPEPLIPYINNLANMKLSTSSAALNAIPVTPLKPEKGRKAFLENSETDPWASPALHQGHAHPNESSTTNGTHISPANHGAERSTSAFTPSSDRVNSTIATGPVPIPTDGTIGWGPYDDQAAFPTTSTAIGTEFGETGGSHDPSLPQHRPSRALGGGRLINQGMEEIVSVSIVPEKEGLYMFQHRNYEVKSVRRSSTVVRRYSDFVWLLDCLHKRYPARALPLLPPKRVGVNGSHLSSDVGFIEKRRRGLVRFMNALVRHPVLSQEQLMVMFLTVPTELAVWRKQASISVQEEFSGKALPPGLEDSLPTNLTDTFLTIREGIRKSADTYIGLCNLMERLTKRRQGVAADTLRFSQALKSLAEDSAATFAIDTNDVPLLNAGVNATARHLDSAQAFLEDETRAWDEGVLEDLKRQRDTLVSMRELFDRRDRLAKDNIPQLERRIEANEGKLTAIRQKPSDQVKHDEQKKVEQAILTDKQSIVSQHARGVLIKECIREELLYFQNSQYHVSKLHQDWSQELVKYSELQADNWRALTDEVENMPLGE